MTWAPQPSFSCRTRMLRPIDQYNNQLGVDRQGRLRPDLRRADARLHVVEPGRLGRRWLVGRSGGTNPSLIPVSTPRPVGRRLGWRGLDHY